MRDCSDCKKYFYFNGVKQYGPDGKELERQPGQEPQCKLCEKFDEDRGEVWEGFTPKNEKLFRVFLICWFFKKLPFDGGVFDQDEKTIEVFMLLAELFSRSKDVQDKKFQMQVSTNKLLR